MIQKLYKLRTILFIVLMFNGWLQLNAQNFEWARGIGSDGFDIGVSTATDQLGNVYTLGLFQDSVNLNPEASSAYLHGRFPGSLVFISMFLSKHDASGNFLWGKVIEGGSDGWVDLYTNSNSGGTGSAGASQALSVDDLGNVYTCLAFSGTVDFDPGPAVSTLTSQPGEQSVGDYVVVKFDTEGNFKWAKDIGKAGGGFDFLSMTVTSSGIITIGSFIDSGDFDPGVDVYKMGTGLQNAFVSKLDTSGNFVWAKMLVFSGRSGISNAFVAADTFGNVHVAGSYQGTIDLNPGSESFPVTSNSNGRTDFFILKLNRDGDFVWATNTGSNTDNYGDLFSDIAVDVYGSVYVSGYFHGTMSVPPLSDSVTSSANGTTFIAKLNTEGDFVWFKTFRGYDIAGGADYSQIFAMALDRRGNIFTTGAFGGTVDFDPDDASSFDAVSIGSSNYPTPYLYNAFVNKLDKDGNFVWFRQFGYDSSLADPTIPCDIAVTEDGDAYTVGFYRYSDLSSSSQFSNIPIDFDPGPDTFALFTDVNGLHNCYIHKIGQCINTTSRALTYCDSFIFNNRRYTESGIYIDTLFNAGVEGCDSVVNLNLTISRTPDNSVTENGPTLTATTANASYQWIDCDQQAIIPEAISQSFTATSNGNYAVVITNSEGCSDTSVCVNISSLSIHENRWSKDVSIHPNPTSGALTMTSGMPLNGASLRLLNVAGQVMMTQNDLNGNVFHFDLKGYASGIYFLELVEEDEIARMRVIKD